MPTHHDHSTDDPALQWGLSFAHGYLALGMLDKAERELDRLGSAHQDRADVMTLRTRVLLARRTWPRLCEVARRGAHLFPLMGEFYLHAVTALDMLGRREEGRRLWNTAPDPIRRSGRLHLHVARFEMSLGNSDGAREHLQRALALEPALLALAGGDPLLSGMIAAHVGN